MIPPLIGFFSKQFVLYSAVQSGYFFISIVAIITSVISASYYLKIIKVLHDSSLINSSLSPLSLKMARVGGSLNEEKVLFCSNSNLRRKLFEIYANFDNKEDNNYQYLINFNYFKEIQLIFILIFIFKFELICKNILNNNTNMPNVFNIYTKKEFWQLNNSNYQSLAQIYLNKINNEIDNKFNNSTNNIELNNISLSLSSLTLKEVRKGRNINFFYKLSNFHSFLISNLTIIILLFVLKPSILLSSTRLLSLSLFTY